MDLKDFINTKKVSNPCIRCGRERIESETWEETVTYDMGGGTSILIHTKTVCPDSECQKIVEEELEIQRIKAESYEQGKGNRRTGLKRPNQTGFKITKSSYLKK